MSVRALILDGQFKGQMIELPDNRPLQRLLEGGVLVQYELNRHLLSMSIPNVLVYRRDRFVSYSLTDWYQWARFILETKLVDARLTFSAWTLHSNPKTK